MADVKSVPPLQALGACVEVQYDMSSVLANYVENLLRNHFAVGDRRPLLFTFTPRADQNMFLALRAYFMSRRDKNGQLVLNYDGQSCVLESREISRERFVLTYVPAFHNLGDYVDEHPPL